MRRVLLISVLLHVGVAALVLLLPRGRLPPAEEPARMEVIFGDNGTRATPPAAAAAPAMAPMPTDGTGAPPPLAAAAPPRTASADPGLRIDRPDASLIPARDDAGNHAPDYPPGAWTRHEQGTVLIRLHIAPDGTVTRLEKLASSGHAALDDAAMTALSHWHFVPASRDGRAVPSYRDQPVRFVIE